MNKTKLDADVMVDFKLFIVMWNQKQGMKTPHIHLKMAIWLEERIKQGDRRVLMMAFRAAGKSTITGLLAAWLLYRRSDLRILVLAADHMLAGKMVRNVKRIIERHPLTSHMKPEKADQWAGDKFTVRRNLELRDPSMLAKGIGANITGSRADIVICDDVEVPATCDSAEKRDNLRERLAEMVYLLGAGGTQIYIGTPHHYYSIYAEEAREEIGEDAPFLDGFERYKLPLLDEAGNSTWPDRFTNEDIAQIKHATGPNKFESQMMLRPVNIAQGRLDPDLLQFYAGEVDYTRELKSLFLNGKKMVAASCWWDPAFGSARGDRSVMAIIFADDLGNYYLHHIAYIRVESCAADGTDEASAQCEIVAALLKRFHIPSICVETNGIGKFLPNILRNILARENVGARVVESPNSKPKDMRILESFDAPLAAERLYVHESVRKTPFVMEMREWQPGKSSSHDDGLDAVAGALSALPDRLPKMYSRGSQSWMSGAKGHMAKTII